MTFYNTTNLKNPDLFSSIQQAEKQEDIILNYFKKYPDSLFSCCDLHNIVFKGTNTPLTSTRRSFNTLMKDGHIIKTDQYKTGIYNKKVYLWTLKK